MESLQFEQTRLKLKQESLVLFKRLNGVLRLVSEKESLPNNLEWTAKETVGHIYLVNQYLIRKVKQLIDLLNEGLVNEESEFVESDLGLVETMLNVSVFKIKSHSEFQIPLYYSLEELELKITMQVLTLTKLIQSAPEAFANNYLAEMKVIPGIKLDVYQLLFFAFKHAQHHLTQIENLNAIKVALGSETPLKMAQDFTYSSRAY